MNLLVPFCTIAVLSSVLVIVFILIRMLLKKDIDWKEVDRSISSLIWMLNQFGIKTTSSCSGHQDRDGYIDISPESFVIERDDIGKEFVLLRIPKEVIREIEVAGRARKGGKI
jgi:hypothetical protein